MIQIKLTTWNGSEKKMTLPDKATFNAFIEQYANALPIGTAVCVDAPLIGVHSGWVQGRKSI